MGITLAIAAAGAWIGKRLRLPTGALLGAMVFVGAYQLLFGYALCPKPFKIISQGLIGSLIGTSISAADVRRLKRLTLPSAAMLLLLLLFSIGMSALLVHTTDMDLMTALCATVPGGIADLSILGSEMGGDPALIATVQTVRLMTVVLAIPQLVKLGTGRARATPAQQVRKAEQAVPERPARQMLITLALGLSASAAGYLLRIPAGTITLPLLATAAYHLATGKGYVPARWRSAAQTFNGAMIGTYFNASVLTGLRASIWPILGILLAYLLLNLVMAAALRRIDRTMSFATAMLATAPGGMSDMGIIAAELGGDLSTVSFFQQLRYSAVILCAPLLLKAAAALCG